MWAGRNKLRQPSQHKDICLRTGDVFHDTGVVVEHTTLALIQRFKSGPKTVEIAGWKYTALHKNEWWSPAEAFSHCI
jgi:hypothetical protein